MRAQRCRGHGAAAKGLLLGVFCCWRSLHRRAQSARVAADLSKVGSRCYAVWPWAHHTRTATGGGGPTRVGDCGAALCALPGRERVPLLHIAGQAHRHQPVLLHAGCAAVSVTYAGGALKQERSSFQRSSTGPRWWSAPSRTLWRWSSSRARRSRPVWWTWCCSGPSPTRRPTSGSSRSSASVGITTTTTTTTITHHYRYQPVVPGHGRAALLVEVGDGSGGAAQRAVGVSVRGAWLLLRWLTLLPATCTSPCAIPTRACPWSGGSGSKPNAGLSASE